MYPEQFPESYPEQFSESIELRADRYRVSLFLPNLQSMPLPKFRKLMRVCAPFQWENARALTMLYEVLQWQKTAASLSTKAHYEKAAKLLGIYESVYPVNFE